MKLRLENGNFKVVGIVTKAGQVNNISFNKLPVGLDPIDFLGVIAEIHDEVLGLGVTYSGIAVASFPAMVDDIVYDDFIALYVPSSYGAGVQLYYNKATGELSLNAPVDSEDPDEPVNPDNPGDGGGAGK